MHSSPRPSLSTHTPGPGTVLLVAAPREQRARYAFLLRALRYACLEADDARDAMVHAESGAPNVVLLDVPDDGETIRLCRQLKRVLEDRVPVLLALSREGQTPLLQRVADSGAEDYVTRPVDEVDLVFKLRRMMRYALQFQTLERRSTRRGACARR